MDLGRTHVRRLSPVRSRPRFPSPLIERSVRFSRTALSGWFHVKAYDSPARVAVPAWRPRISEDRLILEPPGSTRQNLVPALSWPPHKACSEGSGCSWVFADSSSITNPPLLHKPPRSRGPFLPRHSPASWVV